MGKSEETIIRKAYSQVWIATGGGEEILTKRPLLNNFHCGGRRLSARAMRSMCIVVARWDISDKKSK